MKKLILICTPFIYLYTYAAPLNDSAKIYYDKGIVEKESKRYQQASANFDKAIKFDANYFDAYLQNAYANTEMRRIDVAKNHFTKANQIQPNNAEVIKELSTLYYNYRQWDKAIEFINKCTSCENRDRIIGMCNFEKENYMEAERYLLKALAKLPNDAQVNYTLARNYMDMDAYRRAVPYLEKAVLLEATKSAWAYELGLLYYNNNNFRGAVTAFENAEKAGYTVSNDFNENYGYALLYSGQFLKGEEKLFDIYKRKGNPEMLRELAQILYDQKQYDRSLDYCQRLLELNPKDGKALYQAGLSFIKLGKKDKGQSMCDKAIELDPSLASKKSSVGDMGGGGL